MHEVTRKAVLQAGLSGMAVLLLPPVVQAAPADAWPGWNAFIAIVWPQDGHGHGTGVAQSRAVNIAVWPRNPVRCTDNPTQAPSGTTQFQLWRATNNDVARVVASRGALVQRTVNGVTFPSVEFDAVPADLVRDPAAQYRFTIGLTPFGSGFLFNSNVWVHALDARTSAPQPVIPTGLQAPTGGVDARIQIVWPHDAQGNDAPVSQATRVNIAFDLFAPGTLYSVPLEYEPWGIGLMVAEGNGPMQGSSFTRPTKVPFTVNGQTFPRWVYNDVPVTPGQPYHFAIWTATGQNGGIGNTNFWTHAADARTTLPNPQVPPACTP